MNAVSGLPAGRAKRVNPPLTAIFKEELVRRYGLFFRILHTPGDEKPRPGFDNWRQPVGQTVNAVSGLPAGRAKLVNPPLTAIFKEELVRMYGLFFRILHTLGPPPPKSVRARGNRAHQLSGCSVNNQNAQESTEHICVIWSLPITSSLIKMPPTEIHVTCHHKIVMPEESTMEKIVN